MAKGSGGGGGSTGVGGAGGRSARDKPSGGGASFESLPEGKIPDNFGASPDAGHEKFLDSVHFSDETRGAIGAFTGSAFTEMRSIDAGRSTTRDQQLERYVNLINNAFGSVPKRPGEVFRGMYVPESRLPELISQKSIVMDAMSSASRETSIARVFVNRGMLENVVSPSKRQAGVMLCLKQKTGLHVERESVHGYEHEVMLRKGTEYKITRVERAKVMGDYKVLIIRAEEQ